ncbi:MAG: MBL fold metallo-hydrolase [Deltaproteobacteria bacterium]|nr:MBL fold metallo-hydrolase [Deltaproteobacteria bacterium]
MARFDHLATTPRGPKDLFRWRVLDRMRMHQPPREPTPEALLAPAPLRPNDGAALRAHGASLTWVGHASFALRLAGLTVLTDPIWSSRIQGVVRRLVPPGLRLDAVGPVDLVTVSHNHFDHLDLPTLKRIGPRARYVVPLGVGQTLREAGLPNVVELDWWQSHREGDLEVTLVPARHWSMRMPWTRNDSLWGGFVLRAPEGSAYHSGDTGFFNDFKDIGERLGAIDHALLPIGAYEPRWFMEPQHMNPEDARKAFELLGARTFVAMHWGTFRLTDEPVGEPPSRIRALWEEAGDDPSRLWVLDVGETRPLGQARAHPRGEGLGG